MENQDIPDVLIGRIDKYGCDKGVPWGKYVWGRAYTCGVVLNKKIIYNQDRSSTFSALKDSANDVFGRLCQYKCDKYNLKNGFRIDEQGRVVECEPSSEEEVKIFRDTLESRLIP